MSAASDVAAGGAVEQGGGDGKGLGFRGGGANYGEHPRYFLYFSRWGD